MLEPFINLKGFKEAFRASRKEGKMNLKKITRKKLESEYNATKQQIDEIGCYSTRDIKYLDILENEINRRGYIVNANYKIG